MTADINNVANSVGGVKSLFEAKIRCIAHYWLWLKIMVFQLIMLLINPKEQVHYLNNQKLKNLV